MRINPGNIDCKYDDLDIVIEGLNLARSLGTKIIVSKASVTRSGLRIPFVLEKGSSGVSFDIEQLFSPPCDVHIGNAVEVAVAAPWTLNAAARLRAEDLTTSTLSRYDLLPQEYANKADPFEGLIGLEEPKRLMRALAKAVSAFGREAITSPHVIFKGNPGSGKSEMARAFSQACAKSGVSSGCFKEVSASQLISNYVGESPMLVRQAFEAAQGGVIFVDEAYALYDGDCNNFGQESINELVFCMEKYKEVSVIAAGYADKMEEFLLQNSGLKSRFAYEISFPDYTDEELTQIFGVLASKRRFELVPGVDETVYGLVDTLKGYEGECFGNARTMRNLLDQSIMQAALVHPSVRCLTGEDVAVGAKQMHRSTKQTHIGFV